MKNRILIFLIICSFFSHDVISQDRNKKDAKGRKQGYWKSPNINGTLIFEGNFVDDIPQGTITYTHAKEKYKFSELTYLNENESDAVFYHPTKEVKAKGKYINDKKQGKWEFFDVRGNIISQENYEDDKKHGEEIIFFEDGEKAIIKNWKDGVEHGEIVEYYNNGNIKYKGTFQDGNMEGLVEMFYYNGKHKVRGKYQFSVKHGLWIYYNEDGTVARREIHEKGFLKEQTFGDEKK